MEAQFLEEEKRGAMVKMSWEEALAKYGDTLWLASLGAIPKSDSAFRVIHDSAHAAQG